MKLRDLVLEWKEYIRDPIILAEGGNATAVIRNAEGKKTPVVWGGRVAQAKPIVFDEKVSRSDFARDVRNMIRKLDDIHRRAFDEGLYEESTRDAMLESGYTFMGSSEFLFAPTSKIDDREYTKHKKKTGDIDLLVSKERISTLFQLLNELRERKITETITFVGHNKLSIGEVKGEQINGIFEYNLNDRSFLFQIDFVFVAFNEEGLPYPEEKFLRGSTWEDIKAGIKGIGHKLLLQSIGARIKTIPWGSALIATGTSTPEKIRLKTNLPDISNIRVGQPGLTPIDLESLAGIVNIKKIPKSFMGKISSEELERFLDSLDEDRITMFNDIVNKQGLAQNQTVSLLVSFVVHSPTVPDFKLDSYFDSFSSLMSFSMGRGLSTRYKLEPYKVGDKDVYRFIKFEDREEKFRKAEDIFEAIFGNRPTIEDVKDIASFLGLLRIINRYLSPEKKIAAYDGLFFYFYESKNFMSAHDIQDDLVPKAAIMQAFEKAVPEAQQSEKFQKKEEYLSIWVDRYLARMEKG